jgi:diguanylate cyclase (GGDEF)-like protein
MNIAKHLHFREWFYHVALQDIFSTKHHSRDFSGARAEYMYVRVRVLSIIFGVMSLFWIPIDFFSLNSDDFTKIFIMRLVFSGFFFFLAFRTPSVIGLRMTYVSLSLFFAVPALFYIGSRIVLNGAIDDGGVVHGYAFFPYLMVALLGIFPMTLLEGIVFAALSAAALVAGEIYANTVFTPQTLGELWFLGLLIGIALWIQLSQLHMLLRLYREASLDPLTGLVNRRVLVRWMELEIEKARMEQYPLSILLFDLDKFKQINDVYGHLSGDIVLRAFGKLLSKELRERNLIGRYGGEEFLAILPRMSLTQASEAAERMRAICHDNAVRGHAGDIIHFTTSIGVAEYKPGESFDAFIARVDQGLYQAKEQGRDMVVQAI